MDDYIKREDVLVKLSDLSDETCIGVGSMRKSIQKIPAVNMRPIRRAAWLENNNCKLCLKCSLCGCCVLKARHDPILRYFEKYTYCPHCGAMMVEEKREVTPNV